MEEGLAAKSVYIVVSQTGTVLSRILRLITRKEYNHASISMSEDLHIMYSFGRKNPYNPFWGGFVKESASFGTFKRFSKTKVIVLQIDISAKKYEAMRGFIDYMVKNPKNYGYNYWGLYLAAFKIHFRPANKYYCSEFVREILIKCNVNGADKLSSIVHPMNFLEMPDTKTVYQGKLCDYSVKDKLLA